jgi:uncharacterized protein YfdQ (DUF2303 family)
VSTTINNSQTEAAVVAELAARAVEIKDVAPGVYLVPDGKGSYEINMEGLAFQDGPAHKQSHRQVNDSASFVAYLGKHGRPASTELYVDESGATVIAVIDSHQGSGAIAGWQQHKLQLELEHTPSWTDWLAADGNWLSQTEFAEFIEQHAADVLKPDYAFLMEMAQSFEANTAVEWAAAERLSDGSVKLNYAETVTAKAGQKGDLEIPKELELALRPYVGSPVYRINARFRYRFPRGGAGQLALGFVLDRPDEKALAAFRDIVTEIKHGKTVAGEPNEEPRIVFEGVEGTYPIYNGKPGR